MYCSICCRRPDSFNASRTLSHPGRGERKHRPRRSLTAALLAATVAAITANAPAHAADAPGAQELEAKQAQLERIRERIGEISEDLEADQSRQSELEQALQEAEEQVAALAREIGTLERRIDAQQARLRKTRADVERTRTEIAAQQNALAAQIRAAYVMGRQERIKLLLSQQDPAAVGRMLTYYDYFNRARERAIRGMRERVAELAQLRGRLESQTAALRELKAERSGSLAALEAANAERDRALRQLDEKIEGESERLASLRADEQALETLMQRLRKALEEARPPPVPAPDGPFPDLKGELPWPLEGELLAGFGDAKQDPRLRWEGIWIGAPAGDPVRAVASGRVVYVGWMHRYGLLVIVAHGNDYYSLYGHNQGAYVQVGDAVRAGQTIARAGRSGGHGDSGLYFELREGKTPLDPLAWLR